LELVNGSNLENRDGLDIHQDYEYDSQTDLDKCHREINVFFLLVFNISGMGLHHPEKVVYLRPLVFVLRVHLVSQAYCGRSLTREC
jgi:hypothetical protein